MVLIKLKDKEKIMTQPMKKKDERAELVKLFRKMVYGQLKQHCIVHLMCNARSKMSKTDLLGLLPLIKDPLRSCKAIQKTGYVPIRNYGKNQRKPEKADAIRNKLAYFKKT